MFREFREIIRLVSPNQKQAKQRQPSEAANLKTTKAITAKFTGPFRFLDLPPEVRGEVFEQIFEGASITICGGERAKVILNDSFNLDVLKTCRNVRNEALPVLIASSTLHLLDKRPQHLIRPIPGCYMHGIRKVYLLPRLNDHLDLSAFPSLQDLLIFMSREELFVQPKPSAEDYEDTQAYSDADLIVDARAGLLNSGRYPEWLLRQAEKSRAERGYSITICCTIWHKRIGNHLDVVSHLR